MSATVVTATLNPAIDKTFWVDRLVADRKLRGQGVRRYPGGGGINVARAVVRLGGNALAFWSAGPNTGALFEVLLAKEEVPHQGVQVAADNRENIVVRDASSEQQYRFGMPGPELGSDELQQWRHRLQSLAPPPEVLVLSGSLPPGAPVEWYSELIRGLSEHTRVVLDTKAEPLRQALRSGVYLIKPNVHELEEIAERPLNDDDEIHAAARAVVDAGGARVVLVSLGGGGALLVTDAISQRIAAPTVRIESKVGAGDSMVGGLAYALARSWPLPKAARYAVAAGAAAVMTAGTELCRRDDVERLFSCMQHPPGGAG